MRPQAFAKVLAVILALLVQGCLVLSGRWSGLSPGPTVHETVTVPLEDVSEAQIDLRFQCGDLDVRPGDSDALVVAECTYNVEELAPVQTVTREGELLLVDLRPADDNIFLVPLDDDIENHWQVELHRSVPVDLRLKLGAGSAKIELGGVPLTALSLEGGAGEVKVNFDQPNPVPMSALRVELGAAEAKLNRLGNAGFERLYFAGGVGEFQLDFRGEWQRSATAYLDTSVCSVKLVVPHNLAVKITPEIVIGGVEVHGFHKSGASYVNDAWHEDAEIKLEVIVTLSVGQLELRQRVVSPEEVEY